MNKIGFAILTWNSEKYIANCLDSIMKLQNIDYGIVIADNGSSDNTVHIINDIFAKNNVSGKKLKLIEYKNNIGTTISRNAAVREFDASYDYICILDSDTVINEPAMQVMIDALSFQENNAIAGPRMCNSEGVYQNSGRKIPTLKVKISKIMPFAKAGKYGESLETYSDINTTQIRPVGYLMSACWMIKHSVIDRIGMLDEKIFYAPEDVEYCIRAWKNGLRVLYCNNARIIHEWQRLSRKKKISRHNWEHIKGLIYMFRKYHFWFNADKIEKLVK